MKTDEILGQIDSCLEDYDAPWPDAMRVAPRWDEPIVHPPSSYLEQLLAEGWDGYAATAVSHQWYASVLVVDVLAVVEGFRKMATLVRRIHQLQLSAMQAYLDGRRWRGEIRWQPGDREHPAAARMHAAYHHRRRRR